MTPQIAIETLNSDAEIQGWQLDQFAAEFGHEVPRLFPIHVFFIDGEMAAFLHNRPRMCCYPAFHDKLTPRQFFVLAGSMAVNAKATWGDPLIIRPADQVQFTDRLLEKVYMRPAPYNFYEVKN